MEPFIILSEGGNTSDSNSESLDSSTPLSTSLSTPLSLLTPVSTPPFVTHDTSRTGFHKKDLESFAKDLQSAADRAFPNEGRNKHRYRNISVLLLRWEDDKMGVCWELEDLEKVFVSYGFDTERWLIPRKNAHLKLMSKVIDVVEEHDEKDDLVIVYYAGHAYINDARQATWCCDPDRSSASLQWSAIQTLFEKAQLNVLFLLDCCAAASAAPTVGSALTETIAACGFENIAPRPGRFSFTNTLIKVLQKWINKPPFSASMLHHQVLSELKHQQPEHLPEGVRECRATPIYIVATSDLRVPSIELGRRRPVVIEPVVIDKVSLKNTGAAVDPEAMTDVSAPASDTVPVKSSKRKDYDPESINDLEQGKYKVSRVIVSLALDEDQNLNTESCQKWLTSCPALVKFAKIEAVYKSFSTMVLVSVPIFIWNLLPEDPACAFVGYVTSPNMLGHQLNTPIKCTSSTSPSSRVINTPIINPSAEATEAAAQLAIEAASSVKVINAASERSHGNDHPYDTRLLSMPHTAEREMLDAFGGWDLLSKNPTNSPHYKPPAGTTPDLLEEFENCAQDGEILRGKRFTNNLIPSFREYFDLRRFEQARPYTFDHLFSDWLIRHQKEVNALVGKLSIAHNIDHLKPDDCESQYRSRKLSRPTKMLHGSSPNTPSTVTAYQIFDIPNKQDYSREIDTEGATGSSLRDEEQKYESQAGSEERSEHICGLQAKVDKLEASVKTLSFAEEESNRLKSQLQQAAAESKLLKSILSDPSFSQLLQEKVLQNGSLLQKFSSESKYLDLMGEGRVDDAVEEKDYKTVTGKVTIKIEPDLVLEHDAMEMNHQGVLPSDIIENELSIEKLQTENQLLRLMLKSHKEPPPQDKIKHEPIITLQSSLIMDRSDKSSEIPPTLESLDILPDVIEQPEYIELSPFYSFSDYTTESEITREEMKPCKQSSLNKDKIMCRDNSIHRTKRTPPNKNNLPSSSASEVGSPYSGADAPHECGHTYGACSLSKCSYSTDRIHGAQGGETKPAASMHGKEASLNQVPEAIDHSFPIATQRTFILPQIKGLANKRKEYPGMGLSDEVILKKRRLTVSDDSIRRRHGEPDVLPNTQQSTSINLKASTAIQQETSHTSIGGREDILQPLEWHSKGWLTDLHPISARSDWVEPPHPRLLGQRSTSPVDELQELIDPTKFLRDMRLYFPAPMPSPAINTTPITAYMMSRDSAYSNASAMGSSDSGYGTSSTGESLHGDNKLHVNWHSKIHTDLGKQKTPGWYNDPLKSMDGTQFDIELLGYGNNNFGSKSKNLEPQAQFYSPAPLKDTMAGGSNNQRNDSTLVSGYTEPSTPPNLASRHPAITIPPTFTRTTLPKRPSYQRPKHDRVLCDHCIKHPEGFRGVHELSRHHNREHRILVRKWICVEPTEKQTLQSPMVPLSSCKPCTQQMKAYSAYWNAAAHLRRVHFKPNVKDKSKRRGGKHGDNWPPISELKHWMKEIEVHVNDEGGEHMDSIALKFEDNEGDEDVTSSIPDDTGGVEDVQQNDTNSMCDIPLYPKVNSGFDSTWLSPDPYLSPINPAARYLGGNPGAQTLDDNAQEYTAGEGQIHGIGS